MILKKNYNGDFSPCNSISSVLGFSKKFYKSKFQVTENTVNVLNINRIIVNTDSYVMLITSYNLHVLSKRLSRMQEY